MIDRSLMVTTLTVLREQRDLACGTEETALFNEINLRATSAITTTLLREHVQTAADRGWMVSHRGALNDLRWRITPAGVGALSDLNHGG